MKMVKVGQKVPEFTCTAYQDGKFTKFNLAENKGKWVVLFFYPLDFTFICPTEIRGFAAKESEFTKLKAVVVGASTDSEHSHKAWLERDLKEVKFPILADTTHAVSRLFNVLKEDQGIAYRATFIIDPEGMLRFSSVSDMSVGRSVDETLRVLKAFQTGQLCPVEWKEGQKTLGNA